MVFGAFGDGALIYIYILYCYYILRKYPITKFRVLGLGPLKKSSLNL